MIKLFSVLLAFSLAPAWPDSAIRSCYLNYGVIGWTQEAAERFVQETKDSEAIAKAYEGPADPIGGLEWSARNDRRGSRAFRAGPNSTLADANSVSPGSLKGEKRADYLAEMALLDGLSAARAALRNDPKNPEAHLKLAALVGIYLQRTGVPTDLKPLANGEQALIVKPMTPEEWSAWNRANHRGAAGEEMPKLMQLANYLSRRGLALELHTDELANLDGARGHFLSESHIGLGFRDVFDLGLTSTFLHENVHSEGYRRRNEPWGDWADFERDVLLPSRKERWGEIDGVTKDRPLRTRLPYVEVTGKLTDEKLKGTAYEKRYLIEEQECCYRQALYYAAMAKRFKSLAEREGADRIAFHAYEMEQARDYANKALERLRWVERFGWANNYSLYDATTTGSPGFGRGEKFEIRKSLAEPFDLEIRFQDGKIVRFLSAQFPDLPKDARTKEEKEEQIAYFKVIFERVRRACLTIEFNASELRSVIREDFPLAN